MTGIPVTPGELVDIGYLNEVARAHYRKTTAKQVVNTVTETDLLNGEITIGAGAMGTNRMLRLTMMGDCINNVGATQAMMVFKLKLGATTIMATPAVAAMWATSTSRGAWRFVVEIANLGAANSQWSSLQGTLFDSLANNLFGLLTTGQGAVGTAADDLAWIQGVNASAVDTTVAQALVFTVTNPLANALLDVTLKSAIVEIV